MIAENCTKRKIVVMKSTVPVGTHEKMRRWLKDKHYVISNPEFLREGTAVYDFMNGDRIVIGRRYGEEEYVDEKLKSVYSDMEDKIIWMDNASAETVKYAANSLLATKLALWNEIAALCFKTGADIHQVRRGVGSDSRIGPRFLLAGPGYGGSCFPKDTRGLYYTFKELLDDGTYGKLIKAVIDSNDHHKGAPYKIFWDATLMFDRSREKMKIAILGLAFKGGTDDTRESPVHTLLQQLDDDKEYDYEIVVADPVATQLPDLDREVTVTTDYVKALQDAHVVFVMTEWQQYKTLDLDYVKSLMSKKYPTIIDARNMWSRHECEKRGFTYRGIGS
jgi:UDPglucose 6-dehydrogenase